MNDFLKHVMEFAFEESLLRDRGFEKLLLEAVDEGLSSLGDSSKQVIYFHLEKTFKINKQDIPHRIEEFADAIEKIFGVGAKFLEILIMRRLYEKVGNVFEFNQGQEDLVFIEYVAAARQSFLKKKKQEDVQCREMKVKAFRRAPYQCTKCGAWFSVKQLKGM